MRKILFILLLLPLFSFGQWKYLSAFENGIFVESELGNNISINYNKNFNISDYGFFSASAGLAYILGYASIPDEPNPYLYQNSGLGLPITVSYNYSLGNLDQRIFGNMFQTCKIRPPRFRIDWFLEAGAGISPAFYKEKGRNTVIPSAFGGGRIQMYIRRPFKNDDAVIYIRGNYKPYYGDRAFRYGPAVSIGMSI